MADEKPDQELIAALAKRRRRVAEILAGDLPTTSERLAGYPPLRGSEADDRRVYFQSVINRKIVFGPDLRVLRHARDNGSIEALLAASDVLEQPDFESWQRIALYLTVVSGRVASGKEIVPLISSRAQRTLNSVDGVFGQALARGLVGYTYARGDVTAIVASGLKLLSSEHSRFMAFKAALAALDKDSATDEDDVVDEDAAGALARIARAQDAVEAAASAGPGLIVVPVLDLKGGSIARRDTLKPFESIAGKRLQVVEPDDLRTARDRLLGRYPHFSTEIDLILRQRLPLRLLLVGSAGCGKTSFAKALADALALPSVVYPAGGSSDSSFAGTSAQWSSVRPSVPLQLVQRSRTANPLVVIDEIEKSGTSRHNGTLTDSLLAFLEPASSRRILDPALELEVDLSAVSSVATANSLAGVPGPLLDRLRVIQMPDPRPEHVEQLVGTALDDIAAQRSIDRRWLPPLAEDELDLVRQSWPGGSLRRLRRIVELIVDGRDREMGRA